MMLGLGRALVIFLLGYVVYAEESVSKQREQNIEKPIFYLLIKGDFLRPVSK